MDHSPEQSKFEIRPVIEQKPFENPAVQAFFKKWCKVNDSIMPRMVSRQDWEYRGIKGILEKNSDTKQTLFLPEDLQLWEMVGVMEVVDHDTFAKKPDRQNQKKEELMTLGKLFKNSGVYIIQRLDSIDEGKEIATALAEEFYEYGQSLEEGKPPEQRLTRDAIATITLTPEEIGEVDQFLAGESLYRTRRIRAEKEYAQVLDSPRDVSEFYEAERKKTLVQFFRVSQKAFELRQQSEDGELNISNTGLNPWQNNTPIHDEFIKKITRAITHKIETPNHELTSAIFRRGMEKLVKEMREHGWKQSANSFFEKMRIPLHLEQKKLADILDLEARKAELEKIRQSGDVLKISAKEREIADAIQKAVSGFPRRPFNNNPAEILVNQYINCVGASTLGGALMQEAGLHYLVGVIPDHSVLFLVTEDRQVEWRDMLEPSSNAVLVDDEIRGQKKDGSAMSVSDIVEFSLKPNPEGLLFDIESPNYRKNFPWIEERERPFVVLCEPTYGQQILILNSLGKLFADLGKNQEAVIFYHQAIVDTPAFVYPYNGLGNAYMNLGRYEEARKTYMQATRIDAQYFPAFYGLGNALCDLGRYEEAIKAYNQTIIINPNYPKTFMELGVTLEKLGRNKEALAAFEQYVRLADEGKEESWLRIAYARTKIENLRRYSEVS